MISSLEEDIRGLLYKIPHNVYIDVILETSIQNIPYICIDRIKNGNIYSKKREASFPFSKIFRNALFLKYLV